MKIYAGSDHAGFQLKQRLVSFLREQGHELHDVGVFDETSADYPDAAALVGRAVRDDTAGARGLLVCGSGIGVCIAANKIHGVRAVDAWNVDSARISRAHNDTNVLCLGGRMVSEADATTIVEAWLEAPFEGGRHARRVGKMARLEEEEATGSDPARAGGST